MTFSFALAELLLALVIAAVFALGVSCARVPERPPPVHVDEVDPAPACLPVNPDCDFPEGTR